MKKYEEKISKLNEDEKFTYFLTDEEDGENIYNSRLKLAEEKAIQRGLEKGLEQGLEKGIKSSSIKIAKEMLKDNINIDKISLYTNLSIEEIKNIAYLM